MCDRHNVYVIELDKDVLYEAQFKKANPGYITGKLCVYVGMTAQHMKAIGPDHVSSEIWIRAITLQNTKR